MHALTPAARQRIKLETLLQAVAYYQRRLAEELAGNANRPEAMQALPELRELWQHRMDVCKAEELRLKEQIAELDLDLAYAKPAAEPSAPVTKPKRRSKAKAVEGFV